MMRYDVAFVKRLYNQIVKVNIFGWKQIQTSVNEREVKRKNAQICVIIWIFEMIKRLSGK